MNRAAIILMICVLGAGLVICQGCRKTEERPRPKAEPATKPATQPAPATKAVGSAGTIGISVLTMANPFFKDIVDAVTDEAAKDQYEIAAVDADFDPARQRKQVQEFIVKKVVAIILTPADSMAVGTAIKEANEAGIPVFTADIASLAKDAKVVCHVATDNYSGGRQAAKAMMLALGNKGKVAIIDHPEVESVILRTKGFRDELKEAKSPIEIVMVVKGKGSKDKSLEKARNILTVHPDLDGIFAINDPSALGAVAAVEIEGRAGKVKIIGFDGMPEGKQAIRDGKIFADPIQFPDQIARKTVQMIVKYLKGQKVPSEILIPTKLYFQADAKKDPALKAR